MAMSSLEASVDATLDALRGDQWRAQQPFTIFRVPASLRESNRTAYEPRMVSIGPYYHGTAAVRAMEDHKWRYLHDLLRRLASNDIALVTASDLATETQTVEAQARACYSESLAGLASDNFVRMLLLDDCFILEFFKWHTKEPDALIDVRFGIALILSDLLLMENQIQFFVLERLYDVVAGAQGGRELLLNLFVEYISMEEPIRRLSGDPELACLCAAPDPVDAPRSHAPPLFSAHRASPGHVFASPSSQMEPLCLSLLFPHLAELAAALLCLQVAAAAWPRRRRMSLLATRSAASRSPPASVAPWAVPPQPGSAPSRRYRVVVAAALFQCAAAPGSHHLSPVVPPPLRHPERRGSTLPRSSQSPAPPAAASAAPRPGRHGP
ncbi:hypothetical protein E2562_023131 [Oryza meyeriana var. granulata]|uniref:Uncharacterized protein n=1 Tax=Oryza meyeriana var. granulata TaxID=110450 RepID=A0A6G1E0T7_9ORYZ|nr:hypothetical protein E2562_023131 [Oryza meyeriana var. granulata]